MIFLQIQSGGDRNFGYLVGCEKTKKGVVIDPSPDPHRCHKKALDYVLDIQYVINTHDHYDHSSGNDFFINQYNSRVVAFNNLQSGGLQVKDGDKLSIGDLELSIIHTPGHTPDSICVLVNNELLTGDTLFVGKVGGTSTRESAEKEFRSLRKLIELDPSVRVWPGHDVGIQPSSTIGEELKTNPFILRLNNFEDFIWLKDNWASYKEEHGIA